MDNGIERQRDARIYIVSVLIFLCIISGGVFLCLYIFLPESQTADWYPIAGIILVCIPWSFWFITCIYRCLKPMQPPSPHLMHPNHRSSKASSTSHTDATSTSPSTVPPVTVTLPDSSTKPESQVHSPGTERRVHFGEVTVMDNEMQGHNTPDHHHHDVEKGQPLHSQQDNDDDYDKGNDSESEIPLRLTV